MNVVSGMVSISRAEIGNGSLLLPLMGGKFFEVFGGPYLKKPENFRGVCMAAEIPSTDIRVPTPDYETPDHKDLIRGLHAAVDLIRARQSLYVGCMGGIGRTGLFLAAMVKLFGVKHPVHYVRSHYLSHAVETQEQQAFISALRFPCPLRAKVQWLKVSGLLPSKTNILNPR